MKKDRRIEIMGILNLTDDSYFAESRCADVGEAVSRVGRMLEEGADIIDFGACSTRPGSLPDTIPCEPGRSEADAYHTALPAEPYLHRFEKCQKHAWHCI